jgi:sec-independent protein translocase protein TatA
VGALSPLHLIIVLVVAVLIIGPKKLPEVGASLGAAMKSMRDAMEGREPDVAAAEATALPDVPASVSQVVAPAALLVDPPAAVPGSPVDPGSSV